MKKVCVFEGFVERFKPADESGLCGGYYTVIVLGISSKSGEHRQFSASCQSGPLFVNKDPNLPVFKKEVLEGCNVNNGDRVAIQFSGSDSGPRIEAWGMWEPYEARLANEESRAQLAEQLDFGEKSDGADPVLPPENHIVQVEFAKPSPADQLAIRPSAELSSAAADSKGPVKRRKEKKAPKPVGKGFGDLVATGEGVSLLRKQA